MFDYYDSSYLSSGGIGVHAVWYAEARFDNVIVKTANKPYDILLSPASIAENTSAPATVGTLSASDADSGDTHTFALVSGSGSTDNGYFFISGNQLRANATFDYESKSSYSIRVRATDSAGLTYEKPLTVSVLLTGVLQTAI